MDQHTHLGITEEKRGEREREKGAERIRKEIMAKNSPNLMKGININIQEAQQTPSKLTQTHAETHYNHTFRNQR